MWPEASSLAKTLMGVESLELSVGKVDGKFITGLPSGSLIYGFFVSQPVLVAVLFRSTLKVDSEQGSFIIEFLSFTGSFYIWLTFYHLDN